VSNDHLNQLQLAKQLKQKAEDAQRSHKSAQDELDRARKLVESSRSPDIDLTEADRRMAEASSAFTRRDYVAAQQAAADCVAKLQAAKLAAASAMIGPTEHCLGLLQPDGRELPAREALAKAKAAISAGDQDQALKNARAARDLSDTCFEERAQEEVALLKGMIASADKHDVPAEESGAALAAAEAALSAGMREEGLESIQAGMALVTGAFTETYNARASKLTASIEDASAAGVDVSSIQREIDAGRAEILDGDMEKAMVRLARAERSLRPLLSKAVIEFLPTLDARHEWLRSQGLECENYSSVRDSAESYARSGEGEMAMEWLRRCDDELVQCEADIIVSDIQALRPAFKLARAIGADTSGPQAVLEEAREAVLSSQAHEAVNRVKDAGEMLSSMTRGSQELERELIATASLFQRARLIHVDLTEASDLVERARATAVWGDLRTAAKQLREARLRLQATMSSRSRASLIDLEVSLAFAIGMGVDMSPEEAELDAIMGVMRSGGQEDLSVRLSRIGRAIDSKGLAAAEEAILQAEEFMYAVPNVELALPSDDMREARKNLNLGDWKNAYLFSLDVISKTMKAHRVALDEMIVTANGLINIGRMLGIETMPMQQKLSVATSCPEDLEALGILSEVIKLVRVFIKGELDRSLAVLKEDMASHRRDGVIVTKANRILSDSSTAMRRDELERAFTLFDEGEKELQKTVSLHKEVSELLATISANMAQAMPSTGEYRVPAMLAEAQALFKAGRYDAARTSARNCYQELETVATEVLAPQRISEARKLCALLYKLDGRRSEADKDAQAAEKALSARDYATALASAKESCRKAQTRLESGINDEIEAAQERLFTDNEGRHDLTEPRALVNEARMRMAQGDMEGALDSVRQAVHDANSIILEERTVWTDLLMAEGEMEEVEPLGVNASEARGLINQAHNALDMGERKAATALISRALSSSRAASRTALSSKLNVAIADSPVKGRDAEAAAERASRYLRDRLDRNRFKEADEVISELLDNLRAVSLNRSRCEESLSKAKEFNGRDPLMKGADEMLARCRAAHGEGAYEECLVWLGRYRVEVSNAEASRARWTSRLEEARARFAGDAAAAAILKDADAPLREGRYDELELVLLRAEEAVTATASQDRCRDVAAMINAALVLQRRGLSINAVSKAAGDLLDVPLRELHDPYGGHEEAMSDVISAADNAMGLRRKEVEALVKRAKGTQRGKAAQALLDVAMERLESGDFIQASNSLDQAALAAVSSPEGVQSLRDAEAWLFELIESARMLDIDVDGAIASYREAITSSADAASAADRIADAAEKLDRLVVEHQPCISLRAYKTPAGGRGEFEVILENVGGGIAIGLAAAGGCTASKAPKQLLPGQAATCSMMAPSEAELAITYRGILTSSPMTAHATGAESR